MKLKLEKSVTYLIRELQDERIIPLASEASGIVSGA